MTHNLRDGKANKGCSIVPDIGEIQRLYTCFNFHTSLSVDRNDCYLFSPSETSNAPVPVPVREIVHSLPSKAKLLLHHAAYWLCTGLHLILDPRQFE